MKETKNYDMFTLHPSNREIVHANLDKIKRSIQIKNLLEYRPMIVDKQMRIIDGQHRWMAARDLGLTIYYQVQEEEGSEDIFLLNANQKAWTNEDFMRYYSSNGNENYIKMKKFMDKHQISFKECMAILEMPQGGDTNVNFRQGKFKFPNAQQELESVENLRNINAFISFVATKTATNTRSLGSACLKKSLIYFFNLKCFDFSLFMKKLEVKLELFRLCSKTKDYMEIFARIYNYRNQNPIQLDEGVP